MNVERIRELANVIEVQPHTRIEDETGFNMRYFEHDCGSPACIGGWANFIWGKGREDTSTEARGYLGISLEHAESLFFPDFDMDRITPTHAAAVLRNLADTGKVDWSVGTPVEA